MFLWAQKIILYDIFGTILSGEKYKQKYEHTKLLALFKKYTTIVHYMNHEFYLKKIKTIQVLKRLIHF